jgi:hypothetical protein
MQRRQLIIALALLAVGGCEPNTLSTEEQVVEDGEPTKIRLIPDAWRIRDVGRLSDGRLFWVDGQLLPSAGATKDFVCTFIFDQEGRLVDKSIELIGDRGAYPHASINDAISRHLSALGDRTTTDIWVRPFSIEDHGTVFGLIPRHVGGNEWRVEFMPGNTLSFYPPWKAGEYDT